MLYIVSDHGGFRVKTRLVRWLRQKGMPVVDLGPERLNPADDYPLFAARLARHVQRDRRNRGLAVCRSGVGMAMAANKFRRIRAVQAFNPRMAKKTRQDEDANILSLAADYHSPPELQRIVWAWLREPFRRVQRFRRRLTELNRLDHGR